VLLVTPNPSLHSSQVSPHNQPAADSAESAGCSLLMMRRGTSLLSSSLEAAARSSRITLQQQQQQQQQQQRHEAGTGSKLPYRTQPWTQPWSARRTGRVPSWSSGQLCIECAQFAFIWCPGSV
jgi:hypothetical protein